MYEALLDHARRSNEETIRQLMLEKQIKALKSRRPFRMRFLLAASDILLTISTRIRPQEFQAYNKRSVNTSESCADLSYR